MNPTDASWDVIVVGGGIAGLSLAAALSPTFRVCVLEKERALSAHTTGRSVATFIQSYGNATIQALNTASLPFFRSETATDGTPFARPLPFLYAASEATVGFLETIYDASRAHSREMRFLDADLAVQFCPLLRPEWVVRGLVDPAVLDIDVHTLMQHHAATVRRNGGMIATSVEMLSASREHGNWRVQASGERSCTAKILVNCANAWADHVATRCGAQPLGIHPLRRSVFTLEIPDAVDGNDIPMVNAADEEFYFKPDAGRLLCSPADETEARAGERGAERADEFEIARALDGLSRATVLDTRHVHTAWAGLRCFAADRTPVVGWDPVVEGLFWYTALGGYGIQTSPALSRIGATVLQGRYPEEDVIPVVKAMNPARFRSAEPAATGS